MTSRRQAAWGESMREAGAAVEVEAGVLGRRGNLLDEAARAGRAGACVRGLWRCLARVDMVLIAVSAL